MHRLNVSLTDEEIAQVFKLMDSDASNFVDSNEFTMFLTQRFESKELTRFQDCILRKVKDLIYSIYIFCDFAVSTIAIYGWIMYIARRSYS